MKNTFLAVIIGVVFLFLYGCTLDPAPSATVARPLAGRGRAVIVADIVALDEMLVYNRFGSFNPFGMIYALRDDVVPDTFDVQFANAKECEAADVEAKSRSVGAELKAGHVRLRDCKRPRPLVLRANVGDTLEVHFQNLLRDVQPDVSQTYCPEEYRNKPGGKDNLEDVLWKDEHPNGTNHPRHNCKKVAKAEAEPANVAATDWPKTRRANFAIAGLKLATDAETAEGFDHNVCLGVSSLAPGQKVICRYEITQEGPYFASSTAAIAGGEGDGGSLTHGLFAAVLAQPEKSAWYRSQVTKGVFDAAWPNKGEATQAPFHARRGALNYEAGFALSDNPNYPYLNMLTPEGDEKAKKTDRDTPRFHLAHADINAIVRERRKNADGAPIEGQFQAFREFTVVLHDELKTFYPDAYKILTGADESRFTQLAGVRDGFGINYGAGGMGPMLIANRKKIGPAADCIECLYEEFFLQSWANGDPALLERFPDDPSNVHHSYLNDRIVFRNFHAGPKETHVFHLHAHQWFAGNDTGRGAYLDSQTVGPQQGFTYRIYDGGLKHNSDGKGGWWESHGAGNRNRSPGDSIFHCHLYPHFAQGMWELWRNHDVLEDGSRKLSDGQRNDELSIAFDKDRMPRPGSVSENMAYAADAEGTPIPAVVPLPDEPLPLLPTYGENGMPGYPFYIAGKPGHRVTQPPLDIAKDQNGAPMDGGLPRHVILKGQRTFAVQEGVTAAADADTLLARMLANGDMSADLKDLRLQLYDPDGTTLERNAMGFHHDGAARAADGSKTPLQLLKADGTDSGFDVSAAGYSTFMLGAPSVGAPAPAPAPAAYYVNGAPPAPGAPFADPCGVPTGFGRDKMDDPFRAAGHEFYPDKDVSGFRRYEASAVQLEQLIVNRAGWHDPQARIDVLTSKAFDFKKQADKPNIRRDAEPFFFRARSGDCIEFRHTNELPKDLERDDFQVKTPTDTVGQHIHLVKFDVTASDGSGNGWNYEDGTFAPDELYHRICESSGEVGGSITDAAKQRCGKYHDDIWMLSSKDHRELFQTTVQRWFADPILSASSAQGDGKVLDRTMRTVFSHDHFGPSSIQQHGFYTALIIEPHTANVCPTNMKNGSECDPAATKSPYPPPLDPNLHVADDKLVGAQKLIIDARDDKEGLSTDAREYALAVADFALLYDPHSGSGEEQYRKEKPAKGLVCLAKEANTLRNLKNADDKEAAQRELDAICGGGASPILYANYTSQELARIARALQKDAITLRGEQGRPVAAPTRPESISVDHHDPYLVNYRDEPVPLRVGTDKMSGEVANVTSGAPVNAPNKGVINTSDRSSGEKNGHAKGDGLFQVSCLEADWKPGKEISVARQRKGAMGDLANVFRSVMFEGPDAGKTHGDPCTPIIEGYDLERIQIRLIQGAQEVQHAFTVEGFAFPRHYDQRFPSHADFTAMSPGAEQDPTFWRACHRAKVALGGLIDGRDRQHYREAAALCDNIEGRESAQEIGISEHFEFAAPFRREGAMQGPVSHGGGAGAERKDLLARPAIARRLTASDYLYHFGTLDALWNGAWGLLRVHEMPTLNKEVFDIGGCLLRASDRPDEFTNCLQTGTNDNETKHVRGESSADKNEDLDKKGTLETRLTPLYQARAVIGATGEEHNASTVTGPGDAASTRARSAASDAPSSAARRPMPRFGVACLPGAPHVRATAVAIESTDVDPKGVLYHPQAPELRDPNGRLLVLVDAHASDDKWPAVRMREIDVDAPALIAAASAKARETQQQVGMSPMVLRINAGDCLDLTIVNGLKDAGDAPGDALMPKIVPLNLDTHNGWDNKTGIFLPGDGKSDIPPSKRIAFSVPLTATMSLQATPWPVGISPMSAIGPLEALRQFFYAGQLDGRFHDALGAKLAEAGFCAAPGFETVRLVAYDPRLHFTKASDRPFIVDVYGRWHTVEGIATDFSEWNTLAQCIMKSAGEVNEGKDIRDDNANKEEEKQRRPFFWPYAFGVLPIKPVGDTFNHTPHGLFGALVVEPQGAQYEGRVETVADPNAPQVTIDATKMLASARIKLTKSFEDGGGMIALPSKPIREHVLFWQDGLNLHATTNGQSKPVADCHVCDDTYDFGKKGVNYRSTPFYARLDLRGDIPYSTNATPADQKKDPLNGAADYNAVDLGEHILHPKAEGALRTPLVLDAEEGEEAMFRVVHPGGRARQRAFVMTGNGFDDLFPGFGFPNAALLAPGKAVTAATRRPLGVGCHLWRDGPALMVGNGVWGLVDVRRENGSTTCPAGQ